MIVAPMSLPRNTDGHFVAVFSDQLERASQDLANYGIAFHDESQRNVRWDKRRLTIALVPTRDVFCRRYFFFYGETLHASFRGGIGGVQNLFSLFRPKCFSCILTPPQLSTNVLSILLYGRRVKKATAIVIRGHQTHQGHQDIETITKKHCTREAHGAQQWGWSACFSSWKGGSTHANNIW